MMNATRLRVHRIRGETAREPSSLRPARGSAYGMTGGPRRPSWAPAFVTAAAIALLACGDKSATTEPPQPTNRPPVAVGRIPALILQSGEYAELNVAGYFSDPDGDPLTYALHTNSDPGFQSRTVSYESTPGTPRTA